MKIFTPEQHGKWPGVVLLPGSDGGIPEFLAKKLAFYGFTVLPLGYFGAEGFPQYLDNISLDAIKEQIEAFSRSSQVLEGGISVLGYSRGGELALLLGSTFPKLFKKIASFVPSAYVGGGFPFPNRPAWLLNGQPIAFTPNGLMNKDKDFSELDDLRAACEEKCIPFHANSQEDPYVICDLFEARDAVLSEKGERTIPVEKIECPLLIVAGNEDQIWPSARYATEIGKRLDEQHSVIDHKIVIYPNAGHGIIAPYQGGIYHPQGRFWCTLGGTLEGNRAASEAAWRELINFLR